MFDSAFQLRNTLKFLSKHGQGHETLRYDISEIASDSDVDALEIQPNATEADIKKAYRKVRLSVRNEVVD